MEEIVEGNLRILSDGPVGFGNNIYVLVDTATNEAAFVDAPGEAAANIALAEAAGARPSKLLLTHSHADHTACLDDLKAYYGLQVYGDPMEPWLKEGQLDVPVGHGSEVRVGGLLFRVVSIPGHTPGAIAFIHNSQVFSGDTLFPGGPGHSRTNANLQQEIRSIVSQLFILRDDMVVRPGHGLPTTIGRSKAEYAVFAAKPHDPDLHGDVLWLES
jgi:glyoxylase-like metal-dependent hydrolase (beta-lactamase superfamily II)